MEICVMIIMSFPIFIKEQLTYWRKVVMIRRY